MASLVELIDMKHSHSSCVVYDDDTDNTLQLGSEGRDRTSGDIHINKYNRREFRHNTYLPLLNVGFNADDGLFVGAGIMWTKHGFRKKPYKSNQAIRADISLTTLALKGSYTGEFIDVLGSTDLFLEVKGYAPTHVINYFGLGNETVYTEE